MEEKYRPISAWGYLLYDLLFFIPVVGLVFAIIFSFNNKNINRRGYARHYLLLCGIVLFLLVVVLILCLFVFNIKISEILNYFKNLF